MGQSRSGPQCTRLRPQCARPRPIFLALDWSCPKTDGLRPRHCNIHTHRHRDNVIAIFALSAWIIRKPFGTGCRLVTSRGDQLPNALPTSDAKVSPQLQDRAPSTAAVSQDDVGCCRKSKAYSPQPTFIM